MPATGMTWLTATAPVCSPEAWAGLVPGSVHARLRIDRALDTHPSIALWIVAQDARMLIRALRAIAPEPIALDSIHWSVEFTETSLVGAGEPAPDIEST